MGRVFTVIATLVLAASAYLANFGLWAGSEIVEAEAFTASALESFARPGSEEAIGVIVADKVVQEYPVLRFARTNLESLLATVLATEPLEPELQMIAEDVHDRLFGGVSTAVVIDLGDYEEVLVESIDATAPGLISLLPSGVFREYTFFDAGEITDLTERVDLLRIGTMFAAASMIGSIALLLLLVRPWTVAVGAIGVGLMLASLMTFASDPVSVWALESTVSDDAYRVLAVNLFDVSSGVLIDRAAMIGIVGAVLTATALIGALARRRATSGA